jgi:putative SOS response-associated peptidase YedK
MCGRYVLLLKWREINELHGLTAGGGGDGDGGDGDEDAPPEFRKRYNQAPTEKGAVVRIKNGKRELVMLRWGWDKMSNGNEWINARSEGIVTSAAYGQSFRLRRCLIPASGFYEWRRMPSGRKAPYWIGMKDKAPFALAGLWKEMTDLKTGELRDQYLVITCPPNHFMAELHNRMPVIIDVADYDRWLSAEAPVDLLRPYPAERMMAYEISTKINKAGYDAPDILDPVPPARDEGPAAPELPL